MTHMKRIWSKKRLLHVFVGASIGLALVLAAWDLWSALGQRAGDSAAQSMRTHVAE